MTKYRRIEITAFCRSVRLFSGRSPTDTTDKKISITDTVAEKTIETESDEGQQLLMEAVRLLEERVSDRSKH